MKEIILKEFKSMVKTIATGKTVSELFTILKKLDISKLELMMIDSAIKYSRLETLYITLLLKEDIYYEMIQSLTYKLYWGLISKKI